MKPLAEKVAIVPLHGVFCQCIVEVKRIVAGTSIMFQGTQQHRPARTWGAGGSFALYAQLRRQGTAVADVSGKGASAPQVQQEGLVADPEYALSIHEAMRANDLDSACGARISLATAWLGDP